MAKIGLTREQSENISRHIREDQLKALIAYRSGRIEAEFIDPETAVRERVDLTPTTPRQVPRAHRWTSILLFGGMVWAGVWFMGGLFGFISVPAILIALNVTLGVVASVAGIFLAEQQLGTPVLISPQQSAVLRRELEEGAILSSVAGGGGTSLLGRGRLIVQLKRKETAFRYVIGPSGDVERRETATTVSNSGGNA